MEILESKVLLAQTEVDIHQDQKEIQGMQEIQELREILEMQEILEIPLS
jgi:hypothetical protein